MSAIDTQLATEVPQAGKPDASRNDSARDRVRRLISLDATRGLAIVILLIAGNPFMREHLPVQLKHPAWNGLRFADLFFPLFLFVAGVSMILSRRAGSALFALQRVALLFLIGLALSFIKHGGFVLHGVLQHIAGAYLIAWLVTRAPKRMQLALTAGIFILVWSAYVVWGGDDPWSKDHTLAHTVDGWLIGRFSTEGTLQTVISSVTVLGGALVGHVIVRRPGPQLLLRKVATAAAILLVSGLALAPLVPINKRIWSPSFTLLTLGLSCAMFALFIWVLDIRRHRSWATPMIELGANPILIYVAFITIRALVSPNADSAPAIMPFGSGTAGALLYSLGWLLAGWLLARFLYRRRIFVKI